MILSLNGTWKLNSDCFSNLEFNIPGSVLSCLLDNKLIGDPFYAKNELKTIPYLKKDYSFKREFTLTKENLLNENYLFIDGIDTLADIFINNCLVKQVKNMHIRYRIHLDNSILKENNIIEIKFYSAINYVNNSDKKKLFYSWGETMKFSPVLRKAHYSFGWDWGPCLPDMGLYRDIYIVSTSLGFLNNYNHTIEFNDNIASLKVDTDFSKISDGVIKAKLLYKDELIGVLEDELHTTNNFNFKIKNPKLWYPSGYGKQELYDLIFIVKNDKEEIEYRYKLGLKKFFIDDSKDEYGLKFKVYVNDKPIFLKGSDYIPMDNILSRVTKNKTYRLLKLAKDFNHNIIRVWGGGYYPDDYFFEICDELGLLVFEDYMFACATYDMKDIEFKKSIIDEALDVIKRIRNHASLLLMCGNNENEEAITNWKPYRRFESMENFMELNLDILKNITKENSNLYYLESSPTSREPYFKNPNDYNNLDMHYWDVWHGYKPFSAYKTIFPRLLSEFGCQSFATFDTIKTFAKEKDYDIFSKVMMHHQKNRTCNDKILGYTKSLYKNSKDFKSLVYLSELAQAEGIKSCVEHLRRNSDRCYGVMYWQINDCWPGQSWSSIDYEFGLKALHYYSKKFYDKYLLSVDYNEQKNKVIFNVSNEDTTSHKFSILPRLVDFNNSVSIINNELKDVHMIVEEDDNKTFLNIDNPFTNPKEEVIVVDLLVDEEYYDTVYFTLNKPKDLKLKKPKLTIENIDEFTLKIKTNTYTKNIYLEPHNNEIIFSDNYFDLLPNEEKIIKTNKKIDGNKIEVTNLYESW